MEKEKPIGLFVFWIATVLIALGGGLRIGYDYGKQDPAKAAFQAGKLEGFEMADKGYSAQMEMIRKEVEEFKASKGSSPEPPLFPDLNNVQYVGMLYHAILGRDPDKAGLHDQAEALGDEGAPISRSTLAIAFLASAEFRERHSKLLSAKAK